MLLVSSPSTMISGAHFSIFSVYKQRVGDLHPAICPCDRKNTGRAAYWCLHFASTTWFHREGNAHDAWKDWHSGKFVFKFGSFGSLVRLQELGLCRCRGPRSPNRWI